MDFTIRSAHYPVVMEGNVTNLAFAPISIASVLAMAALGAVGQTEAELLHTIGGHQLDLTRENVHKEIGELLQLPFNVKTTGDDDDEYENSRLGSVANAMFVRDDFALQAEFKRNAKLHYNADVQSIDFTSFQAINKINNWAFQHTYGKIPKILSIPPSPQTEMILVSALFFKAAWQYPFDPKATTMLPFKISETEKMMVPTMIHGNIALGYVKSEASRCTMISIPYKYDRYTGMTAMLVIIPDEIGGVERLIKEMAFRPELYDELIENMKTKRVMLKMPKFSIETSMTLSRILQTMGVKKAFDLDTAQFPRMLPIGSRLRLDSVFHRARLDVDERGTTAAAVTSVSLNRFYIPVVHINRPFIILIKHQNTGLPIFWASVQRPTLTS
ncbi:hypothetical protein B566_EDAN009819 [Ephemera danica]|nr:hypothetical protein B566_EDAN009819 [Ephemera danica]